MKFMWLRMIGVLVVALISTACGGGGSSGGGGGTTTASPESGTFVDSSVNGLHFANSPSNTTGFTSNGGQYQCMNGDQTTFDIGGTVIGTPQPCSANNVVTAVSVFGATSSTDPQVVNLSQLLLTLAGGVPTGQNPINIPQPLPAGFKASNIPPFNQPTATFSAALPAAFPQGTTIVTTADATAHLTVNFKTLSVTIVNSGTVTLSPAGINCTGATGTCSYSFVAGTAVTLTAIGNGFTPGWSGGGCSGTGTCVVPLNNDTPVTATFGQATSSTRWLFYTDNAGTIKYVDPANPGATTTAVTTTGSSLHTVVGASWDATNFAYTNLNNPNAVYVSGGKLFQVSAMKSSGAPGSATNMPVQISSEVTANLVCDVNEVANIPASNTKIFYELPGADGNCATQNDNVTKWVNLSDNATTPPNSLASGLVVTTNQNGNGVAWVADLTTGLPTNVLLVDMANSNTLKRMDLTNNNQITTIQANVGGVHILAQDTTDRVFLRGQGATNNKLLYLYTVSTNTLTTLVTGASKLHRGNPAGDGTNLYVAEETTGKLYKVPMTAATSNDVVTLLSSVGFPLGDPCGSDDVVVTTSDVFLHTYVPGAGGGGCDGGSFAVDSAGLYRVSKANGAKTSVIDQAVGTGIFNVLAAKSLLIYNHLFASTPNLIPQAIIINEDGTAVFSSPTTCPGCGGWSAAIQAPTFFVRTNNLPLSKIILEAFTSSTANGGTLTAFDAPTGTQGATLGTVPNTTPTLDSLFGSDFIDTTTLLVGTQNGSANNFMFFVDAVLANSLTQVQTGAQAPWTPAESF